jgi:hypothetical protein
VHAEVWVESLGDFSFLLVKINNLPLLLLLSVSVLEFNSLSFFVLDTIECSSISEVDKAASLKFEHLPPFSIGAPHLKILSSTRGLDV